MVYITKLSSYVYTYHNRGVLLLFATEIASRFNLMLAKFQKIFWEHATHAVYTLLSFLSTLPLYQPFAEYAALIKFLK